MGSLTKEIPLKLLLRRVVAFTSATSSQHTKCSQDLLKSHSTKQVLKAHYPLAHSIHQVPSAHSKYTTTLESPQSTNRLSRTTLTTHTTRAPHGSAQHPTTAAAPHTTMEKKRWEKPTLNQNPKKSIKPKITQYSPLVKSARHSPLAPTARAAPTSPRAPHRLPAQSVAAAPSTQREREKKNRIKLGHPQVRTLPQQAPRCTLGKQPAPARAPPLACVMPARPLQPRSAPAAPRGAPACPRNTSLRPALAQQEQKKRRNQKRTRKPTQNLHGKAQ